MAPKTRAKSAKAGAKDPNPKQTIKSKLYISTSTREDDSKNKSESVGLVDAHSVRVLGHQVHQVLGDARRARALGDAQSGALVESIATRSDDTEATLQDTANAAAIVSAAPLDSIEPAVDPRESAEVPSPAVLLEWNGRRRRTACAGSFYFQYTYKRRSVLLTRDELEVSDFLVTEDFRSKWASGLASDDELVAAATVVQMKKDPNYSAPVQKESRPKRNQTRRGRRSWGHICRIPIQAYSTMASLGLQRKFC